ncbi:MAG: hypothetical protein RIB65_07270 [Ilumatobacter fluminis]|uniref:hypothetical protein n=1 Tax=Ilumatobacter fluminis TaxID=467091 RepID=UPI0032EB82F9
MSGTYSAGGSFTVTTAPNDLEPCLTYITTDCYYTLYNPSLVRCVYLEGGDPTAVRECGPLNSTGRSVDAQRRSSCSGTLGSVYINGGHAQRPEEWWINRAPDLAECEFDVDDVPIDNLRGPTFFLVRTEADECIDGIGPGAGCDEPSATVERRFEYGWVRVDGAEVGPTTFLVPGRLMDTRQGSSATTVDGQYQGAGRVGARSTTELRVTGRAGVPSDAGAVMLNVTAVDPDRAGHLTVFPCGSPMPTASNLNFTAGQVVPNTVLVKVGTGGNVCIYAHASMHLVVDVNGSYEAGSGFDPLVPARLLETRSGAVNTTVDGRFQRTGRVGAGSITQLEVAGRGGVAADAAAVSLNVTVVGPDRAGHVTVFPCGSPMPTASNLNYLPGQVIPNAVLVKIGDGGKVCIYAHASTHLLVDVNGAFGPASDFGPLVPARLLETRTGAANTTVDGRFQRTGRVGAGSITELKVTARAGVPANAAAVSLNVTVVGPDRSGHVTVFPCGATLPEASNLNYSPGQVVPNAVLAKIGDGGKVCIYAHASTHLLVDVNGAFT